MSRQSSDGLLYCDFCGAVVDESSEDPPFFNALAPVPTIFDADNNFTLCEACFNKIVDFFIRNIRTLNTGWLCLIRRRV